jgi:hypothetical protein
MPRRELTDDERDAMGEFLAGDGAPPRSAMTDAKPLRGMQLPPPDLAEAYAGLPKPWQVGAVLLADRLLAAAYAEDVRSCAVTIADDLADGAVRGMTLGEYVEEATEGHPRVVDRRRALQVLCYSPHGGPADPFGGPVEETHSLADRAAGLFRLDVEDRLRALGVAVRDDDACVSPRRAGLSAHEQGERDGREEGRAD